MGLPAWMRDVPGTPPAQLGKGRTSYVEKTLEGVSAMMEEALLTEKYARRPGLLQSLEPSFKLVSIMALIVTVSFLETRGAVLATYVLTLVLARASNIELRFFIPRVWVFIPMFAGLIALPSIFNVITPGKVLWQVTPSLVVTEQGLDGAVLFVLRVAASVSLAVLLALTTPWQDLLGALRKIRVPAVFVMVLQMTYRYILILLRMVQDYYMAKRSRQVRPEGTKTGQRFAASRMGYLFLRSMTLTQEVHSAMTARGYTGEVRTLDTVAVGARDYLWLGCTLLLCLTMVWSEVLL